MLSRETHYSDVRMLKRENLRGLAQYVDTEMAAAKQAGWKREGASTEYARLRDAVVLPRFSPVLAGAADRAPRRHWFLSMIGRYHKAIHKRVSPVRRPLSSPLISAFAIRHTDFRPPSGLIGDFQGRYGPCSPQILRHDDSLSQIFDIEAYFHSQRRRYLNTGINFIYRFQIFYSCPLPHQPAPVVSLYYRLLAPSHRRPSRKQRGGCGPVSRQKASRGSRSVSGPGQPLPRLWPRRNMMRAGVGDLDFRMSFRLPTPAFPRPKAEDISLR